MYTLLACINLNLDLANFLNIDQKNPTDGDLLWEPGAVAKRAAIYYSVRYIDICIFS